MLAVILVSDFNHKLTNSIGLETFVFESFFLNLLPHHLTTTHSLWRISLHFRRVDSVVQGAYHNDAAKFQCSLGHITGRLVWICYVKKWTGYVVAEGVRGAL